MVSERKGKGREKIWVWGLVVEKNWCVLMFVALRVERFSVSLARET